MLLLSAAGTAGEGVCGKGLKDPRDDSARLAVGVYLHRPEHCLDGNVLRLSRRLRFRTKRAVKTPLANGVLIESIKMANAKSGLPRLAGASLQSHPSPAPVLFDEINAGGLKGRADGGYGRRAQLLTTLQPSDRIRRNPCCCREIADAQASRSTRHLGLNGIHWCQCYLLARVGLWSKPALHPYHHRSTETLMAPSSAMQKNSACVHAALIDGKAA